MTVLIGNNHDLCYKLLGDRRFTFSYVTIRPIRVGRQDPGAGLDPLVESNKQGSTCVCMMQDSTSSGAVKVQGAKSWHVVTTTRCAGSAGLTT